LKRRHLLKNLLVAAPAVLLWRGLGGAADETAVKDGLYVGSIWCGPVLSFFATRDPLHGIDTTDMCPAQREFEYAIRYDPGIATVGVVPYSWHALNDLFSISAPADVAIVSEGRCYSFKARCMGLSMQAAANPDWVTADVVLRVVGRVSVT